MLQITAGGMRRISNLPADPTETRIAFALKHEQRTTRMGMHNAEGAASYTRTARVNPLLTDRFLAVKVKILA
jgi:hypothetical protein